jgi:hypothetical protein
VDDSNIDMFCYNLKTTIPEWKRYDTNRAVHDIVKNDLLHIYNEVMDHIHQGSETKDIRKRKGTRSSNRRRKGRMEE